MGLDGVVGMQQKYAQCGFKFAHNNTRYAGIAQNKPSEKCRPVRREDFDEVAAFDLECFRSDRSRFLECWLFQEDSASMLIRNETGTVSGYGVIRKCIQGHKIGPLFADNKNDAELLYDSLTSTVPNETVFLDVPQPNRAALELAEKKRLQPVFSTVRMYTKAAPDMPLNKIYGITTFELG